jgi:uncharacterized protein (DUF934 family)
MPSNASNSECLKVQGALIVDRQLVVENSWRHLATEEEVPETGSVSVDLARWLIEKSQLIARQAPVAIRLVASDDVSLLQDDLDDIPMVVLDMVSYVDGRSYTHAYWLRERYAYRGDIRIIGEVYRDQLNFLERVGVTQFELAADQDLQDALQGFGEFSVLYQPSADEGRNVFSRRRASD